MKVSQNVILNYSALPLPKIIICHVWIIIVTFSTFQLLKSHFPLLNIYIYIFHFHFIVIIFFPHWFDDVQFQYEANNKINKFISSIINHPKLYFTWKNNTPWGISIKCKSKNLHMIFQIESNSTYISNPYKEYAKFKIKIKIKTES